MRLPEDLHRRLKIACANRGQTIQSVVEQLVRRYVDKAERVSQSVLTIASRGSGGE